MIPTIILMLVCGAIIGILIDRIHRQDRWR